MIPSPLSAWQQLTFLVTICRRGWALQRDDIPMRPSQDFPTEMEIDLELPAPPESDAEK